MVFNPLTHNFQNLVLHSIVLLHDVRSGRNQRPAANALRLVSGVGQNRMWQAQITVFPVGNDCTNCLNNRLCTAGKYGFGQPNWQVLLCAARVVCVQPPAGARCLQGGAGGAGANNAGQQSCCCHALLLLPSWGLCCCLGMWLCAGSGKR